jgi:hypothetical protein
VVVIKPVLRDLAHPKLLKKYIHGKTQNCDRALNALIWDRCHEIKFVTA